MINRKAPRPSRAVEHLQQFCLNNSAGIDCTAPHSNVKNVYDSTNLVSNPDGSLSLRKPLLIKRDWTKLVETNSNSEYTVVNVIPLYTEDAYLLLISGSYGDKYVAIWDSTIMPANKFASSCILVWTDKSGTQHDKEFFTIQHGTISVGQLSISSKDIRLANLDDVKVFHSASSTVLGNCTVKLNSTRFDGYFMTDPSLYDVDPIIKPRFIKVYRNYLHKWFFEIHNPEANVFEIDSNTETYEHPLNTTLDDMYNLQDTYDTSVPTVKQIVPYTFTERFGDTVNLATYPKDTTSILVPQVRTHTFSLYGDHLTMTNSQSYNGVLATSSDDAGYCTASMNCVCVSVVENSYRGYKRTLTFTITVSLTFYAERQQTLQIHIPAWHGYLYYPTAVGAALEEFSVSEKDETVYLNESEEHSITSDYTFEFMQYFQSEDSIYSYSANLEAYCTPSIRSDWENTVEVTLAPSPDQVTNVVGDTKFRGANLFPNNISSTNASIYLKAFCNFPKPTSIVNYYATWLYTLDGIVWQNALHPMPESGDAPAASYKDTVTIVTDELPIGNVDTGTDENKAPNTTSIGTVYAPLFTSDDGVFTLNRIDLLEISESFLKEKFANASFRFKIVSVQGAGTEQSPYKIVGTYGQADYVPAYSQKGEYWYSDLGNSVLGEKLYHKSRIFSFGDSSFKNNIFVSEPGEFVIPFKNTIDINASEDSTVTSVIPWKDYLFVSTPQALYLVSQVESGWITKTANAALGISQADAKCVVAALNSVIFKSGAKVYMFYPNIYAGDDSVINVTDISSPIEHLLEGFDNASGAFAFGTNSEYVLMLPKPQRTLCLSYDYTTRVWTKTEYPVRFTNHTVYSLTDIVLFGQNSEGDFCEYHFNKTFAEAYGNDVGAPYGDILVESENGITQDIMSYDTTNSTLKISPITFGLDTGQKAEAIVTTKQFVETKFVLATLDKADAFPMQLTVHIDGDPHIITRDISTDAAFWKDSSAKGILNTTFSGVSDKSDKSDKSDIFNVLRQLVVRYSGKGKSIRHILEGQSLSNFKLYETYIRYKLLNVKQ